jgi:hypothetical protein
MIKEKMFIKWFCGILLSIALLASGFVCEKETPIYTGVTEEGVYYEVFEVSNGFKDLLTLADSKRVTITVKYDGIVVPPRTMVHTETIEGERYSGTLSLSDVKERNGKTVAIYKGKIYKET